MALYEVLEDGTIVHKAGKNVGNLDCLRTEVVYDMSSSDANKNWGYTSGIMGGVSVSSKNFSKYSSLIVKVTFGNMLGQYVIDLNKLTLDGSAYDGSLKCTTESVTNTNEFYSISKVTSDKTTFYHIATGYTSGTTLGEMNHNSEYYVYKIEGVLKEPAMIYTGAELFEGNGISIVNGVISAKTIKELWTNSSSSLGATTANLSSDDYDYLIIIHTEGSVMIKKGQSTTLNRTSIGYWNTANDTILQRTRSFTYVDDKTYNIGQGESRFWNNGIKGTDPYIRNNELVPYKILGVKL